MNLRVSLKDIESTSRGQWIQARQSQDMLNDLINTFLGANGEKEDREKEAEGEEDTDEVENEGVETEIPNGRWVIGCWLVYYKASRVPS
ncbi:hypothetical protein KQX54_007014 [Cotesia glomerata]|uniref:Uncharacterized protein n=1 Tax=Cotesia glomerata TaxID=32391 RepID=A0AAV7J4R7_COTGL|nr:hypothetical protein KQX54_007014 [Cotesia glomerata]